MALAAGLSVVGGAISQPAGASSAAPVVFGDICSCTGPEASTIAQTSAVLEAWASWTNAHGGIAGHKVQVIVKDDGYNPATSLVDAQELVTQDHIVGLFDNSDEDPSWATYIEQQKVPVFGDVETVPGDTNPDFYPPGTTFNDTVSSEAVVLKRAHIKKMADFYCVEVAICAASVPQLATALKKEGYGTKIVYSAGIAFAAPNYTAQCLAAKEAGATALQIGDASEVVTRVATNCATQGFDPIEVGGGFTVSESWLTIPGMSGNIDVQPDLPWTVHDAETDAMYAALDKYAPAVPVGPNMGEVVIYNWTLGQEALEAGEAGHLGTTPTAAAFTKGLESFNGETLGGLAPAHLCQRQGASDSVFLRNGDQGSEVCRPQQ